MNKIDPKGSYFAGGQSVNFDPVKVKMSNKQRVKDGRVLATLGVDHKAEMLLEAEARQREKLAVFQTANGKEMFR